MNPTRTISTANIVLLSLAWFFNGCVSVPQIIPDSLSPTTSTEPPSSGLCKRRVCWAVPHSIQSERQPHSLVIRAEKEGLPVKISDVARVNGEFPSSSSRSLTKILSQLPAQRQKLSHASF